MVPALEHLNSVYKHHHPPPSPIEKTIFKKKVTPALESAFNAVAATLPDDHRPDFGFRLRRVRDRIANLNHTTFTDDLFHLLPESHVPVAGLEDRIKAFITARQDIIHTGEQDVEFKDFYIHVATIREVLKRIVLTLLRYEGEYESFLNGQETVRFPPTATTVHP